MEDVKRLPNDELHGQRVYIHYRRGRSEGHRSLSEGRTGHIIGKAASASLFRPGEILYHVHLEGDPLRDGYQYGAHYSVDDFALMPPRLPRRGRFASGAPTLHEPS